MYSIKIVLILAVSVLLLYYSGFAATKLLLPARLRANEFLVMPLIGAPIVIALSHYFSYAGFGARFFVWAILALLTVLNGYALARGHRLRLNLSENRSPIALAVFLLLLSLAPLFINGYLTTVGPNADSVGYASRAQYFLDNGLVKPEALGDYPWIAWVRAWLDVSARLGDVYFIALVSALTGLLPHEILTATSAMFFAMSMFSTHVFCRAVLELDRRTTRLALVLIASNNFLLWPVLDGFYSQTVAMALIPLVLTTLFLAILRHEKRQVLVLGLVTSALLSVYPWTVLYLASTSGILVLYKLWTPPLSGKLKLVLTYAGGILIFAASALAFNAVGIYRSVGEFEYDFRPVLSTAETRPIGYAGDIRSFVPLVDVYGLVNHVAVAYGWPLPQFPIIVAEAAVVVAIGLSLIGLLTLPRTAFLVMLTTVVPIIALSVFQRLINYPYGYFKSVALLAPLLLILLGSGFGYLMAGRPLLEAKWTWLRRPSTSAWARRGAVGFCAFVLALQLSNTTLLIWRMSWVLDLDQTTIELRQVLDLVPRDSQILVDAPYNARQVWIGQILHERSISFRPPAVWGTVDSTRPKFYAQEYLIVERSKDSENRRKFIADVWNDPSAHDVIWRNATYALKKRRDTAIAALYEPSLRGLRLAPGTSARIALDNQMVKVNGAGRAVDIPVNEPPRVIELLSAQMGETTIRLSNGSAANQPIALSPGLTTISIPTSGVAGQIEIANIGGSALIPVSLKILRGGTENQLPVVEKWQGDSAVLWSNLPHADASSLVLKSELALSEDAAGDNHSKGYVISLDIYDADRPSHPERHLGFWNVDLPRKNKVQAVEITIDVVSKKAVATVDGNRVDFGGWVGSTGDGRYRASAVLRAIGNETPLQIDESALFEIREGQVTRMEVRPASMYVLGTP